MKLVATGGVEPPSLLSPLCERDRCSTDELCGRMSPPCGRLPNYIICFLSETFTEAVLTVFARLGRSLSLQCISYDLLSDIALCSPCGLATANGHINVSLTGPHPPPRLPPTRMLSTYPSTALNQSEDLSSWCHFLASSDL